MARPKAVHGRSGRRPGEPAAQIQVLGVSALALAVAMCSSQATLGLPRKSGMDHELVRRPDVRAPRPRE